MAELSRRQCGSYVDRWGLVHSLAFLHLDGKLDASTPAFVSARVRAAVRALLAASDATPPEQADESPTCARVEPVEIGVGVE